MALANLVLNNPLLDVKSTGRKISAAVGQSVRECREEVRQTSIKSIPQGRVYQRGSRTHRASRRGQPPAVDSGQTVNTIEAKKTNEFSGEVEVTTPYAAKLENQMDRKFVEPAANKYGPKFLRNVTKALK